MPVKILFCYAREDEALLDDLKEHLRPLQRQGLIDVWHDREISAGIEWEREIDRHLNTARIILLLVSRAFMNSDYCYGIEMKRALERHAKGEAKVIPIILRHVYWHEEPFGKLQALPKDGKPVISSSWHNTDEAFYDVVAEIHKVVKDLTAHYASALSLNKERRLAKSNSYRTLRNEATHVDKIKDNILHVVHIFETRGQPATFRDIYRYLPEREKVKLQTAVDDMILAGSLSKYKSGKTFRYTARITP